MIPGLTHILDLLQLAITPVLIVVILVLLAIIVVLLRELQRSRSLQWRPEVTYANQIYPSPKDHRREEVVTPPLQPNIPDPSSFPRLKPSDPDNPLNDKRWLKLVEECVGLFNDLDEHLAGFDPPRQELAEYVLLQLQEILERSDVELIADEATFERHRHQPEQSNTEAIPGTPIIETLSPGFAIGRRVLRRARVRLTRAPSSKVHMEES